MAAAGRRINCGNGVMLHSKKRLDVCGNAIAKDNVVTFTKPGDVALCKIMEPVSPMLNYFEIEILASGNRDNPLIGIGVGNRSYLPSNQPGWRKTSIGYHADDGFLYHKEPGRRRGIAGKAFGPKCTTGDRMGCGVDFTPVEGSNITVLVFFTKNGQQVGKPQKMKRPSLGLYPLIGLHGEGEKVAYLGHRCRLPDTLNEPMQTIGCPSDYWLRSNGVKFTESGCRLEYAGMGDDYHTSDVGFAQANFPISCSNHYFELEILETGIKCTVAIGLCKALHPMNKRLGLLNGSVGYHADTGQLYNGTRRPYSQGSTCTKGDIIGCGVRIEEETSSEWNYESGSDFEEDLGSEDDLIIDYDSEEPSDDSDYEFYEPEHRFAQRVPVKLESRGKHHINTRLATVYFTKNRELVKEMECSVPSGGFYPVVSMTHQGETITVNFEPYSG